MLNDQENQTESFQLESVVTGPPQRILTSRKFLGIGQDVGADWFDLIIHIPGDKDAKVLVIKWRKDSVIQEPQVIEYAKLKDPILKNVLTDGSEISWNDGYEYFNGEQARSLDKAKGTGALVALPLNYQGVVIGCVCFRSESKSAFNKQDVLRIRKFILIASLLVQRERETSALDRFSQKLIRWRVKQGVMSNSEAIDGIAEIMRDIFSPVGIVIDLNAGFKRYIRASGKAHELSQVQQNIQTGIPADIINPKSSLEVIEGDLLGVIEEEKDEVNKHGNMQKEELPIGRVCVLVRKGKGGIISQGASYSAQRAIFNLLTDAVLNAVRDGFHSIIRFLGVALSHENLTSTEQWFAEVRKAALEARLGWVVATGVGNNNENYGDAIHKKIVTSCQKINSFGVTGDANNQFRAFDKSININSKNIKLFQVDEAEGAKHVIVSVFLPNSNARIWFGVEREGFGPELSTLSPWTVFIERLAEMADSALLRLENQQMQNEATETRSLATYVVTSHTVFHQIQNMVRDLANPISTLKEMVDAGVLEAMHEKKELIDMMNKSAERLQEFASAFMNVNKMDTHRPCTLQEVIAESKELFDVSLKNNRISLDVELPNDLKIDIPFNVAFLAISNLLSNAKDAIGKRGGKIRIEAEAVRDLVYCSVINNGPPVDPGIRKDLFRKIGVSTKQGQSIRGWGLYLAHKSLSENRGHIELTKSDPTETRFTIKFPRVRQEQI